ARKLLAHGAAIHFVALFASPYPTSFRPLPQLRICVEKHARRVSRQSYRERWQYVKEMFRLIERSGQGLAASDPTRMRRRNVQAATIAAIRRYQPRYFDGRVHLFLPNTEWRRSHHDALRWKSF